MKFTKWTFFRGLGIALLAGVLLTGCAQVFPTAQALDLPTQAPTETEQATQVPVPPTEAAEAVEETSPTAESEATETSEPGSMEDAGTPPVDSTATIEAPTSAPPTEAPAGTTSVGSTELHATNPATVNLASGKVQLVEFFAFW